MSINLKSLALIGDRRTIALVTQNGTICWYCPGRFDKPSVFASLLDQENGGEWSIEWKRTEYSSREYEADSAILKTVFSHNGEVNVMMDFMPAGEAVPRGICRILEGFNFNCEVSISPRTEYAGQQTSLRSEEDCIKINDNCFFYSSHPAYLSEKNIIKVNFSNSNKGWMFLSEEKLSELPQPEKWLSSTRDFWKKIAQRFSYYGPYQSQVANSIRAIRMLTFEENGGILAAGTTSLPEVPGGSRNFDYRYIWLRDAGMIVSALIRAGSNGIDERRFLKFISGVERVKDISFSPMYTLDQKVVLQKKKLNHLTGYLNSAPVTIGNEAREQLQLGATGNVLLAAKLIYEKYQTREHWKVVEEAADFLAENWDKEDKGIWEESMNKHYTSSKVIAAVGLNYIAKLSEDESQKKKWLKAEQDIRRFIKENCINSHGAFASAAGEEAVDISAILFPTWGYTDINSPEVLAAVKILERDYKKGELYRRHLFEFDSKKEGAFLAGSLWMAQYWIYKQNFDKAKRIINEVLKYSTDLGFFPEEADVENEIMIGNIPQTFVHASFIGAVIDLKNEMEKQEKKLLHLLKNKF